jgi:colanic acid/amylovoran biosynthesis glycosyltransferase
MRVAYLVNQYPRTTHSFIRREIHALEEAGVEVLRYSLRPSEEQLPNEEDREELRRTRVVLDHGILGHAMALVVAGLRSPHALFQALVLTVRIGWRSDRGLLRHLVYLTEAAVLSRWLRAANVDHVHAHFGTNPAAIAMLCHALGGPSFSFTVHGPDEFDKPEFLALREKIRRARFVVAISSFGRSQLYRWARNQDWPKLHVVRCGLDEQLLRARPTPVPPAPRLVSVGRLSEAKGHLLLVEAAALLKAQGMAFEIVLAGDGPLRREVERSIVRQGLEAYVRVLGWMTADEVRDTIQASRALVLPSFAEGLPVSIMEALALGRPVVTTAIAGTPELVQPGVTGWLVPAGAVEALAAAMRAVLEETPARLEAMGRTGAELVRRNHDARCEARSLLALFPASERVGLAECPVPTAI